MAGISHPQAGGKRSGPRPHLVSYILTLNEEANISEAIRSVRVISDEIVVLDSGSEDRTVDVAVAEGAKVWHREFDSEHLQRNWAVERINNEWPGSWVLEIDADERVTPSLAGEIRALLEQEPHHDAYLVTLRFLFDGRILRFGGFSRTRLPRLRRADAGRYEEREVNPHLILRSRRLGRLRGHIVHTDVGSWERHIDKHNRYSSLEARARMRAVTRPEMRVRTLTAVRLPYRRRRWIREHVWNRLPAKPLLLFANSYLICGGWLDGRPGFRNAVFRSWQAMCTDLKYKHLRGDFHSVEAPVHEPARPPAGPDAELVVCILTLNEESRIAETVASAQSVTNNVVVVDSHSSDSTGEIAAAAGADVWANTFRNWGAQRNWALDRIQAEFGDPWVLFLDADERLSSKLVHELDARLGAEASRYDAYLVQHTLVFAGRALRFGGFTGTQLIRLFRSSAGRHEERPVNDHLVLSRSSRVGRIKGRIIHRDVDDWERYIAKQNWYSTLEAREVLKRETGIRSVTFREAISNPPMRRRWLRERVWPAIPARPMVRFMQIYVLSGGLFDGYPGLCIATMQAWAEMCVELKAEQYRRRGDPS